MHYNKINTVSIEYAYFQALQQIFHITFCVSYTIAETHKMGGSIWDLGKNLAGHALKK
jgi:ornithine--oxo-acid transaminase